MRVRSVRFLMLLFPGLLSWGQEAYAEALDEQEAREAVIDYFGSSQGSARRCAKARQLRLAAAAHKAGYYIFDRPEGACHRGR